MREGSIRILPGQYYDAETRTKYNYFPDYRLALNRPGTSAARSVRPGRREVFESGELAEKREPHGADRPVALLADDDLGHALFLRLGVVDLVAVNEQDYVGILFDRARIMGHDPVGKPRGRTGNRQVIHVVHAVRLETYDAVPEEIGLRSGAQRFAVEQIGITSQHWPR